MYSSPSRRQGRAEERTTNVGRFDRRNSMKMKRRRAQSAKKARAKRTAEAKKAAKKTTGGTKKKKASAS